MELAHGVGRVYELPVPLYLYLFGAAATVAASFAIAIGASTLRPIADREIGGPGAAVTLGSILKVVGLVALVLTVATGITDPDRGLTPATLMFWVVLIVLMVVLNAIVNGAWAATDPWSTLESLWSSDDKPEREPPWFLAPLVIYALFWFELVSGSGFEGRGVVLAVAVYTAYTLTIRSAYPGRWQSADPLWILFGFAGRCAPLTLTDERVIAHSPVKGLDEQRPMPLGHFVALFALLGSTTLDNVRETEGWVSAMETIGLDALPVKLLDSIWLALFGLGFFLPFLATVWIARRWLGPDRNLWELARLFGWSLIPIGIAYVLSHNVSLLVIGLPELISQLGGFLEGYVPSPRVVWFAEIGLIVGGHILGVWSAHRAALRLGDKRSAAASQIALTALMSLFTITTLWLLAQPLVVD